MNVTASRVRRKLLPPLAVDDAALARLTELMAAYALLCWG